MRKQLWKMGLGYGKYKASSVSNVHDIDTRSSYRSVIFWAAFLKLNRIMSVADFLLTFIGHRQEFTDVFFN